MNKIIIPSILVITAVMSGMFVMAPVNEAEAVHTTINTAIIGQERVYHFMVGGFDNGGITIQTLIPDTGLNSANLVGQVDAIVTDDPGGSEDVDIACISNADANVNITSASDLDALDKKSVDALLADCDGVVAVIQDPTNAVGVFVTITVSTWPEV